MGLISNEGDVKLIDIIALMQLAFSFASFAFFAKNQGCLASSRATLSTLYLHG